jgi:hypothetical protein
LPFLLKSQNPADFSLIDPLLQLAGCGPSSNSSQSLQRLAERQQLLEGGGASAAEGDACSSNSRSAGNRRRVAEGERERAQRPLERINQAS